MKAASADVTCYYYEPAKATLLRDGVLPAVVEVVPAGLAAHVERHWLHGPHVRVHLAGSPAVVAATAPRLASRLRAYIHGRPSTASIAPATLLARSALVGRRELLPPPYEPIHPDNTVRLEAPDPTGVADLLGSPEAAHARAAVLRAGLPAVTETLQRLHRDGNRRSVRVTAAVVAMAAHATNYPFGLARGYLSFRSHVEGYLHQALDGGRIRHTFAEVWARSVDRVTALIEAGERGTAPHGLASAWRAWTARAWQLAEPYYDRGALSAVPGERYAARARAFGDPALAEQWSSARSASEFHQLMRPWTPATPEHHRSFAVYRFCTNMLYLLLGLCDVTPMERYLAASLLSDAVERLTGRDWRERLGGTPGGPR